MLYCRFAEGSFEGWGLVENHDVVEITPSPFGDYERTGRRFGMEQVKLLAPTVPSKIVAVGLNYKDHITEFGRTEIPKEPVLFLKAPSALIGPEDPIVIPPGAGQVDYEAELGLVMKKKARNISEHDVKDHVLGVVCVNDVTARQLQKTDGQWARAKSFDSFAPVGPWISDGLPFNNLRVESYKNNRPAQLGHTKDLIFPVERLVSFISKVMTLNPGDIISTGTPQGVGPLVAGDVIEIFVEGVGKLRNPVIAGVL